MKKLAFLCLLVCLPTWAEPDFSRIQSQAVLANLAYDEEPAIQEQLTALKLPLLRYAVMPQSQVSYFLTKQNQVQTLVVRGTANLENVTVDLDSQLLLDKSINISLHQGFSTAARAVYQDVLPLLDKSKPIQTTGHSLGGAVAVILALYLDYDGYRVQNITTFGQPKVTNVEGSKLFSHLPLMRLVTPLDMVPLVPALSPQDLNKLDIYWHAGQEVILMDNNQYALTSGFKSMLRATKFFKKAPDETNLHAHKMSTYMSLMSVGAQEVPYKAAINIFGFSFD